MTDLKQQVAIITGASQGIGEAIALSLAQAGCHLVLGARNIQKLEALKQKLEKQFPSSRILVAKCDVRNSGDVEILVNTAIKEFGKVDILINNAGVAAKIGLLQEASTEDIDKTIDTNLKGAIYAMKAVLPHMSAKSYGSIININSVAGKTAYPFWSVYDASKFGLRAITEAVAEEQRTNGIRVVGIYPGAVRTDIWDSVDLEQAPDKDGMLGPEDIAEAVLYVLRQPPNVFISELTLAPTKPAL